jgi:hypothetical protein
MATEAQAQRLRRKVGYDPADEISLPQAEVDSLFEEAAERYDDADSQLSRAAVLYLEEILASSAKMATYRQNQTQENVSDLFDHILQLIQYHKGDLLDTSMNSDTYAGTVRSGSPKQVPTRYKEYPNS